LADRVKILLASDLSRRWTLTEIAAQVRGSPVYLTADIPNRLRAFLSIAISCDCA